MSSSTQQVETVSQGTILGWVDELRHTARSAPWSDLIDFDGIDAMDVLLSPVYLAALNALRAGGEYRTPAARHRANRLRKWAYRLKTGYREHAAARQSAAPGPTDILFWSRDITHTAIMQPIVAAVADEGDHCRMMACQPKVLEMLQRFVPDAVYTMGAWPQVVRKARREGTRRAQQLARIGPWKSDERANDSQWAITEAAVRAAVIEYLPLASEAIANAHAALDAFTPKVLVVGNDLTAEGRAGCRVASSRGVPTAVFMHGSVTANSMLAYHCADRLLVYAQNHCRMLAQHGIGPDRIVVCGAPNLDNRPRQAGEVHSLLQQRLGLRPGEPWILVATSGPGNRISYGHHQTVIDELQRLSRELPEIPLVVKLHRKDRLEYYEAAQKNSGGGKLVVVTDDAVGFPHGIFNWLQGCSLVLTGASAVAVEAMLMDVPVITMDFCDEVHEVDFIDAGATVHVCTGESLVRAVREVLAKQAPREELRSRVRNYLTDAFCALDDRSSQRGAQALHAMFQRQESR